MHEGRVAAFLAVAFFAIAAVAGMLAMRDRAAAKKLGSCGLPATGTVRNVFTSPTRAGETRIDVEFADRAGKTRTATISVTRKLPVGKQVDVMYDPSLPSRALLINPPFNRKPRGARQWMVVVVFGLILAAALGAYAWVPSVRGLFSAHRP